MGACQSENQTNWRRQITGKPPQDEVVADAREQNLIKRFNGFRKTPIVHPKSEYLGNLHPIHTDSELLEWIRYITSEIVHEHISSTERIIVCISVGYFIYDMI
eukprot:213958_1